MKKILLLCVGMFILAILQAHGTSFKTHLETYTLTKNKSFTFIERGIKFSVYLSGNFTYRNLNSHRQKNNLKIYRNNRGFITKVGTVAIYYNSQNQFTRIGTVGISYRNGYISRIGSLIIRYDSQNRPSYKGRVNSSSSYYSYTSPKNKTIRSSNHRTNYYSNTGSNYNYKHRRALYYGEPYDYYHPFFYRSTFKRDYVRYKTDHHFIYYRARVNGEAKYKEIKRRVKKASNEFKTTYKDEKRSSYNDAQTKYHNRRAFGKHSNTYSYYTSFFYSSKFKKNYVQYKIDDHFIYYRARKGAYVEASERVIRRKRKDYKKAYSPTTAANRKKYSPSNNRKSTYREKEIERKRSHKNSSSKYVALSYYNSLFYGSKFHYNYRLIHKDQKYHYYEAKPGRSVTYKKVKRKRKDYKPSQRVQKENYKIYRYYDPFFYGANFKKNYIKYKSNDDYIYYKARPNAVNVVHRIVKRKRNPYRS